MASRFSEISARQQAFIEDQKMFFVATATGDSRINLSPKGMDSLRVIDGTNVAWLNVTGSGNETAAHVQENPRMTIMFCAFEGKPMILRLYGQARAVHRNDPDWNELYSLFKPALSARQVFHLTVDLVQTSCGMGVPFYEYLEERDLLGKWAERKGEQGIRDYWLEKNQESLDGRPTRIAEKNL